MSDITQIGLNNFVEGDVKKLAPGFVVGSADVGINSDTIPVPDDDKPRYSVAGYISSGGYIHNLDRDKELSYRNRWKKFSQIKKSCLVAFYCIQRYKSFFHNTKYTLEAADDSDEAMNILEAMNDIMFWKIKNFSPIASKIGSHFWNGLSLLEWVRTPYTVDGMFMLDGIYGIAPNTIEKFLRDHYGDVYGFTQRHPLAGSEIVIDRYKTIYTVFEQDTDTPDGQGGVLYAIAEQADAWVEYFRKQAIGYDNSFVGDLVIRVPFQKIADDIKTENPSASAKDIENKVEEVLEPLVKYAKESRKYDLKGREKRSLTLDSKPWSFTGGTDNQVTVSPVPQYDVVTIQGENAPNADMLADRTAIARDIARAFSCEDLIFGDGSAAKSLGETKFTNFRQNFSGLNEIVLNSLNEQLIKPFAELNMFDDPKLYPKFTADIPKEIDPSAQAAFLEIEAKVRMMTQFNDQKTWNELRSLFNIPILEDEVLETIEEQMELDEEFKQAEREGQLQNMNNSDNGNNSGNNGGNGNGSN